uniref:Uncharacterized protein n=1 Tax=Tarenaya spinosa TaxID=228870 RepID=Q1KUM4_9ROSI|nr:hypothetical protein [Tarenaya spinosa]
MEDECMITWRYKKECQHSWVSTVAGGNPSSDLIVKDCNSSNGADLLPLSIPGKKNLAQEYLPDEHLTVTTPTLKNERERHSGITSSAPRELGAYVSGRGSAVY